jgi:hypothetical protein
MNVLSRNPDNFTGKFVFDSYHRGFFPQEEDTTPQMFQDISIAVAQIVLGNVLPEKVMRKVDEFLIGKKIRSAQCHIYDVTCFFCENIFNDMRVPHGKLWKQFSGMSMPYSFRRITHHSSFLSTTTDIKIARNMKEVLP